MAKKESLIEMIFTLYIFLVFIKILPLFFKNTYLAFALFFAIIGSPLIIILIYKKRKTMKFFNSRNSLEKIKALTPDQFESFVCDLFEKLGYKAEKVGGPNDGGIDVIAEKDAVKHYIQCKKFITQQVSVGAMRDFYGAITDKLSDAKAFFITTNVFTLEAEKFAEGKPIELIDGRRLMEYVKLSGIEVSDSSRPVFGSAISEKCPWCGSQLVLRTAKKGSNAGNNFYGCASYPKCKFIKSITQENNY